MARRPTSCFSADIAWMDYLQIGSWIQISTRHDVVVTNGSGGIGDSKITLRFGPIFHWLSHWAMIVWHGDPASVRLAVMHGGPYQPWVGTTLKHVLVRADSVRSALRSSIAAKRRWVRYATDAQIDKKVRVIDVFPDSTHLPLSILCHDNHGERGCGEVCRVRPRSVGDAAFKDHRFHTAPLVLKSEPHGRSARDHVGNWIFADTYTKASSVTPRIS